MAASVAEKVFGAVSALAAVVALYSLRQAGQSEDTARQGLSLAQTNEDRLNRQELQQYADKVYLGEPSTTEYQLHPLPDGAGIWRMVINASGLQVEQVWVADDSGRSVNISGLQRCSMYALPAGFNAKDLYFTDPYGRWHRPYGGKLESVASDAFPMPKPDTDNAPWFEPVQDCAG